MKSDDVVSIYLSYKDDAQGWLGLHHQHFTQFITIILAVLAASIAAISQFQHNVWLLLMVVIGPVLNIILCFTAIKVCDRFYERFLEHEAIAMKFFVLSNLPQSFLRSKTKPKVTLFPYSVHLLPERWVNAMSNYETIDRFVNDFLNKGSNQLIRRTFRILAIFNIIVGITIILFSILSFV